MIVYIWTKRSKFWSLFYEKKKQNPTIENIFKGLQWNLLSTLVNHLLLMYLFLWSKCKILNISENFSKTWELPSHLGNSVNIPGT